MAGRIKCSGRKHYFRRVDWTQRYSSHAQWIAVVTTMQGKELLKEYNDTRILENQIRYISTAYITKMKINQAYKEDPGSIPTKAASLRFSRIFFR